MNGRFLINQLKCHVCFLSQIAEETSFFPVTLFRVWFNDNHFSQIKFSCSENISPTNMPVMECYAMKVAGINSPIRPWMLLLCNTSGWLLLNLYIMSHSRNHSSVLYDKIPVFYALKYTKFTTITFYPSAGRPKPSTHIA